VESKLLDDRAFSGSRRSTNADSESLVPPLRRLIQQPLHYLVGLLPMLHLLALNESDGPAEGSPVALRKLADSLVHEVGARELSEAPASPGMEACYAA